MGYLNTNTNALSGNTFRLYLSDYGKLQLTNNRSFYSMIEKFGLGDKDMDYRRFVSGNTCESEGGLSALTSSCFYELPDARGGDIITVSGGYTTYASVMVGPRYRIESNVVKLNNTSLGVNPQPSTIWVKYNQPNEPTQLEQPDTGMFNSCWTLGKSVTQFFPSYCWECSDFNGDGKIDVEDLKIFLNLMGGEENGTRELVGDYNGDGKVDMVDFNIFLNCMQYTGENILNFCNDKEVFCLLCEHLGKDSPCNGDCLKCI